MKNKICDVDFSTFYRFNDPLSNRHLRLSTKHELSQSSWLTEENSDLLLFGQLYPPTPVILQGYMGTSITDVIWTGSQSLVCISERIVDIFLENRFTGWSTYPIEIYDRKGNYLPGYYGFAIKSDAGRRILNRTDIITKRAPTSSGKTFDVFKGIFFEEKSWDGSDIFRIQGTMITVTMPVQQALKKAKVTNVEFIPLTEIETPIFAVNNRF